MELKCLRCLLKCLQLTKPHSPRPWKSHFCSHKIWRWVGIKWLTSPFQYDNSVFSSQLLINFNSYYSWYTMHKIHITYNKLLITFTTISSTLKFKVIGLWLLSGLFSHFFLKNTLTQFNDETKRSVLLMQMINCTILSETLQNFAFKKLKW